MSQYIFNDNEQDHELYRLQLIEKAFDGMSQKHLRDAGIQKGWHCLEVGAGAGSILRWMGSQVGTQGKAIGIDRNTSYLSDCVDPPFTIIEDDLKTCDLPPNSLDCVHLRYVLIHNPEVLSLLLRLSKALKPGGKLIMEEPDFTAAHWIDATYKTAGNEVNEAICALFQSKNLDPAFGSRLPLLVDEDAFIDIAWESYSHLARGNSPMAQVMAESTKALREAYLKTGRTTETALDTYIQGAKDPSSLSIYYNTVALTATKQ